MNFLKNFLFLLIVKIVYAYPPVVMYHGMGDTAYGSINSIKTYLGQKLPNIYVTSIQMGSNAEEDFLASYFMNLNEQVSIACSKIAQDPKLKNGYNAIGFSQGGQIMRAIAQRCPNPPILNLISIGGQHQGVYGMPKCFGSSNVICDYIRKMINYGAYIDAVQSTIVQAEYWQDPLDYDLYVQKSEFLADINNERPQKNQTYKQNLLKLQNFVLVKFLSDSIVQPRESELFEFYKKGQASEIVPLRKSKIYTEDWLGLKQLDESGRLKLIETEGDHLQFNITWFQKNIVEQYLK